MNDCARTAKSTQGDDDVLGIPGRLRQFMPK
jgi:hypothetical protein